MARGQGEVGAEWRARWKASTKTGSPLFEGATIDWNINQVHLAFWSNFYDNIFEHPERPENKVIDNDDLLDKWVRDKTKEMEELQKKNRHTKNYGSSSKSAYDHEDVIIFDEEEWEDVLEEEAEEEEYEE